MALLPGKRKRKKKEESPSLTLISPSSVHTYILCTVLSPPSIYLILTPDGAGNTISAAKHPLTCHIHAEEKKIDAADTICSDVVPKEHHMVPKALDK